MLKEWAAKFCIKKTPSHSFNIPGTIKKWNLAHIEKTQTKLSTSFAPGTSLPVTATENSVINYFKFLLYILRPSKNRSILQNCFKEKAAQVSCSEEPVHASHVICQEKGTALPKRHQCSSITKELRGVLDFIWHLVISAVENTTKK